MSFRSVAIFTCDGCKVIESDEIVVETDVMQARVPHGWARVQINKTIRQGEGDDILDAMGIKFFCPHCSKTVESYLNGRLMSEEETNEKARERVIAGFDRWYVKASAVLGTTVVQEIIEDSLRID